jgi:hypothetical protein
MDKMIMQPPLDTRDKFMLALEEQLGTVIDQVNDIQNTIKKQQQIIDEIKAENKLVWKITYMMDYRGYVIKFKFDGTDADTAKNEFITVMTPVHEEIKSMEIFAKSESLVVAVVKFSRKESIVKVANAIESLCVTSLQSELVTEFRVETILNYFRMEFEFKWIVKWNDEEQKFIAEM